VSTLRETTADLATAVEYLERLVLELGGSRRWRVPEISAACDALTCAAVLLRTQQERTGGRPAESDDLLHEAIALARSTVEAAKFAARERIGSRLDPGERI